MKIKRIELKRIDVFLAAVVPLADISNVSEITTDEMWFALQNVQH